jgi:calcineurin-like phosphoesterase family protein
VAAAPPRRSRPASPPAASRQPHRIVTAKRRGGAGRTVALGGRGWCGSWPCPGTIKVMTTWYTSDLHFGHANISAYSGRPFTDVDAMNAAVIANINEVVLNEDELVVLGDVALGRIDDTLALVGQLHGRLVLVPGNHDRCWQGHGERAQRWRERYTDAGFDEILDDPDPVVIGEHTVMVSHFPYRGGGDHTAVERYSEHRLEDRGDWLLCGHVHELWRQRDRQINIGVDAWGGWPVNTAELETLIAAGPGRLECLAWSVEAPHSPR